MKVHDFDPEFPYGIEHFTFDGLVLIARFRKKATAERYVKLTGMGKVVDTHPKPPRVPEGTQFIMWSDAVNGRHHFAERDTDGTWLCREDLQAEDLEDLPGVTDETIFTPLKPGV